MIALSACLYGKRCRYDGKIKTALSLLQRLESEKKMPVCPEQLGGLPTPRSPSYITNGNGFDVLAGKAKVVNIEGKDNTKAFIAGAYLTLDLIKFYKISYCFLKDKSPS